MGGQAGRDPEVPGWDPPEAPTGYDACLCSDMSNADGPFAWPIVGFSYLVVRKDTLRPGATCAHVRETVAFWVWFWTGAPLYERKK